MITSVKQSEFFLTSRKFGFFLKTQRFVEIAKMIKSAKWIFGRVVDLGLAPVRGSLYNAPLFVQAKRGSEFDTSNGGRASGTGSTISSRGYIVAKRHSIIFAEITENLCFF